MNKYTRWEGITRAIGSIIGSGILFLPSYTYAQAGGDVLISWLLAIIICIPGVFFLSEMVENVKDNSGIGGFISVGLGERIGSLIPILKKACFNLKIILLTFQFFILLVKWIIPHLLVVPLST